MRASITALLLCLAVPAVAGKPASVRSSSSATTTSPSEVTLECTDDLRTLTGATGQAYGVTCPAGCSTGTVYGVGPYSDDSKVCRAAIHAGAIPTGGGRFTLTIAAGQSRYGGSTAGGITSQASGNHSRSFTAAGTSSSTAPAPTAPPAGAATAGSTTGTRGSTAPAPAPSGGTTAPAPAASESQSTCQALSACCAALASSKPALVAGCSTIASAGVQSVCASTLESYRDALTAANTLIPAVCQ